MGSRQHPELVDEDTTTLGIAFSEDEECVPKMRFVHSWKNLGVFPVGLSKRGLIIVQQAISNIKGPQVAGVLRITLVEAR